MKSNKQFFTLAKLYLKEREMMIKPMKKARCAHVILCALITTTAQAQSAPLQTKQLAGPAEEIPLMQIEAAKNQAIRSKSALIPINLSDNQSHWQQKVMIDGNNPQIMVLSPAADAWELQINQPFQEKQSVGQTWVKSRTHTTLGMSSEIPAVQYELTNLPSGQYQVALKSNQSGEGQLLLTSDSPYLLESYSQKHGYLVGETVDLFAKGTTDEKQFTMVKNDHSLVQSAHVVVQAPSGHERQITMFDDGMLKDSAAMDGQFSSSFLASESGLYHVQIKAHGLTPDGKPFFRTTEHIIPVIDEQMSLQSKAVTAQYAEQNKINLQFQIQNNKMSDNARYRVVAEVWDASGPVNWLSTLVDTSDGVINLELDDRWLLAKGLGSDYQLKNIRVEDINHYINVLSVEALPIHMPQINEKSISQFQGEITPSMLQGTRPQNTSQNKAAGGKLMLVHGYCSSDVWGSQQHQFSNSVKFADFNKNRSHDEFAQRIKSFGDSLPSFGVVAHSQGGAAALHLYTYYWSGLDDASSGRLIQSVGTPYQGTPLAGNLASVGHVFGVGCGYNSNLTTSGASAWLSGIPTWARSKVNYYTTSFTDKWWRPDWCQIVTDPFLSDPDDGTTEKHRGQLSGAVNRGHKTGQCHTSGMRDMAQTKDSGRNSTMSSNAAR